MQESGNTNIRFVVGFVLVAVPLLTIAAYAGAVVARKPAEKQKIEVSELSPGESDDMVTATVSPKAHNSCPAGKIDLRQRTSKFDFSMAFGSSQSFAAEPAP